MTSSDRCGVPGGESVNSARRSIPPRRDWTGSAYAQGTHIAVTSILQYTDRLNPDRRGRGIVWVDDPHGFWRWRRLGDVPGLRNACPVAAQAISRRLQTTGLIRRARELNMVSPDLLVSPELPGTSAGLRSRAHEIESHSQMRSPDARHSSALNSDVMMGRVPVRSRTVAEWFRNRGRSGIGGSPVCREFAF